MTGLSIPAPFRHPNPRGAPSIRQNARSTRRALENHARLRHGCSDQVGIVGLLGDNPDGRDCCRRPRLPVPPSGGVRVVTIVIVAVPVTISLPAYDDRMDGVRDPGTGFWPGERIG
jgi:hypothetical protein